ncbi:hypothetical protein RJ641_000910 [Dillenia turbinata]|uniref:Uncharacterized protein n=1 Tax=Dillenia turbinata TaxID=194707 RepID=A0AAN8WFJ0_9MAGN
MGFLRRIAGILGFGKDEVGHEVKDLEDDNTNNNNYCTDHNRFNDEDLSRLPRKGFSVPVQVAVDRAPVGPILVPCSGGEGGVQLHMTMNNGCAPFAVFLPGFHPELRSQDTSIPALTILWCWDVKQYIEAVALWWSRSWSCNCCWGTIMAGFEITACPYGKNEILRVPVMEYYSRYHPLEEDRHGLKWYGRGLRIDEDGDVADEFLDEVASEETSSSNDEHHRPVPKFQVKYSARQVKVRSQIISPDGRIRQNVEYQGRLQWV